MDLDRGSSTTLGDRYAIERELGRGGMATVYLARDRQHDTLVAVKVLHPELAPLFAGERFAREIRITAGLQHPNVVPVLDSGTADGLPFYTMPYVEGESLAARLVREHQLPIDGAMRIAIEVAEALAYAHDRGFIHRDIKPQNILLSHGHAVLADFGIARAMDATGGDRITESGVALGTAMYMSPEQGSGGPVDGRSDIYALGCVLYEMLAGAPPFTGATPQSVLARAAVDPLPPITTVRRTVGPALEQTLARALAKVPADRFPNAHAFKAALEQAAADQSMRPATGRVKTTGAARSRGRTAAIAFGALLVAAGAVFSWRAARDTTSALDRARVAVFPLATLGSLGPQSRLGEDVATVIGHAVDGTGALRWVDGWRLTAAERRASAPGADAARGIDPGELARESRCGVYLTGDIVPTAGDSVQLALRLALAANDSTIRQATVTGPAADAWRLGIRAINSVLPALIPGASDRDLVAGWIDRKPDAVAAFLLGEAAFRRARSADALTRYREALRADSSFTIAAVRGAQAAVWEHRASEAESLIRIAMTQPLPTRYAHFARAYAAYIEGRADSASAEFGRAIADDPDMATAWMQLGETYTHLLPETLASTGIADSAFAEAMRLDPSAVHMLLHPIESLLRRGRSAEAAPLVRRFLAAEPDTTLAEQIRIMDACVARGPASVDWARAIATDPYAVLYAAQSLAVAGSQLPCAEAAYTAIRTNESLAAARLDPVIDTRRWTALVGLYGVLLAEGRDTEAAVRVDSAYRQGEGGQSLMLIGAPLAAAFRSDAAAAAHSYEERWGPLCERCTSDERRWQLGVRATFTRDTAALATLATALASRAAATPSLAVNLMAQGTAARLRLTRDDTAGAVTALTAILAAPVPGGGALLWRDVEARGPERLALARLLLARGDYRGAIAVADVFDSPAAQSYVAYLPASLDVRAAAADSLGIASSTAYRTRLAALRSETAAARP